MPVINLSQMDRRCFQLFLVLSQIHWNDAGGAARRDAQLFVNIWLHNKRLSSSSLLFHIFWRVNAYRLSIGRHGRCCSFCLTHPPIVYSLPIISCYSCLWWKMKVRPSRSRPISKNGFNRDWWIHELRWPIGESMRKQLNLVNPVLSYQWEFMRSVQKMARIYLDNFFN